jgi:hypothetical protein
MRVLAKILLSSGILAIGSAAAARSERPLVAPPPSWVVPADIPAEPQGTEGAATVELLADSQVRFSDEGDTGYTRSVYKIASSQGLGAGSLQLSWDPDLDTLTLHHFRLIRDGKQIDLLGDGSKLTVVRRETNLERAALDGQLTATLQPEDVRVGDVIDLAFSRTRRDPSMGGRSEMLLGPQDGVAYGRNRVRVLWPTSKKIAWRARPGVLHPKLGTSGQVNELVSDLSNVTSDRPPEGAPSRFRVVNAVELSEFPDWAAVSRTFEPLYAKAGAIAPDSPLKAEVARIAAASKDPKVRAQQALILVQEKVR